MSASNKNIWRYPIIIIGLGLCGLGAHLTVLAELGTDPWTVFHMGVSNHIPLTIGQASQIFGLIIIILSIPLSIKPGIGTILNMFFYGLFYDLWDKLGILPSPSTLVVQFIYLLLGIVVLGAGLAVYISAGLGAGPRDGLTLGLHKRFNLSVRLAKSGTEIAALALGYLIGGLVGIGTLIFALTIGPVLQYSLKICDQLITPLFAPEAEVIPQPMDDT